MVLYYIQIQVIGDNNVILNNNIIWEHPVNSKDNFNDKVFNWVKIGDNNIIFGGSVRITEIGNNKILGENHISHDTIIEDHVVLYPKYMTGGITRLMSYYTMGRRSIIQQNTVLGYYSMVWMRNISFKPLNKIFPFFIFLEINM